MQPRPAPEPFLPLAGVRVADFSRLLPGPYCAWVLKRLGASVVKVEDAAAGDYTRMVPPAVGNHGGMFHVLQRGSRSLAVDLRHPEGRGVAERLCAASDVVLEGFRPGVLGAMGLGPEELLERHPRLVVCSISGFGQQGAFRSRAGHDLNYLALAGVLALAGPWGMPAPPPPLPLADLAGGALPAVIGILGALLERDRLGRGRWVDVAMAECAAALAAPFAAGWDPASGQGAGRGMLTGGLAWYRVYRCADGRDLALGAIEPRFHVPLAAALGRPEWASVPLLPGDAQDRLSIEIQAVLGREPRSHWLALLAGLDVCVEPVLDPLEATSEGGAVAARGRVGRGPSQARWAEWPVGDGTPDAATSPAHGEHTSEVLAELGYGAGEHEALRARGVVVG